MGRLHLQILVPFGTVASLLHIPMNLSASALVSVLVLFQLTIGTKAEEPRLVWETHVNPSWPPALADSLVDLVVDAGGNSYVIGTTDTIDGLSAALLNRYDPSGVEKWMSITMAGGPRFTRGNALALDRVGNPIIVATSRKGDGTDGQLIVFKWSAAGVFLYSALINQPDGTSGEGVAVAVDASDHFYVVANHHPLGTAPDQATTAYLRKYTFDGQPEWALALTRSDAQNTQAFAMKLDPAGHALVTGKAVLVSPQATAEGANIMEQTAYTTFKVSPQGTVEWSDVYARTTHGDNHATAIATDAQGDVYVTGVSTSPHSATLTDVTTLKYANATGARVWISHFDAIEQADDHLGIRSFAGTSLAVEDYVWVGCNPYLLIRLWTFDGSDGGFAYTHQGVNSGVDATIDRLLLLEPGRGLLLAGSISDDSSRNDLYVQQVDASLNRGWSFRFHPEGTKGSQIASFARGLNNQLNFAANYYPSTGVPASDGVLFAIAPTVVPTVEVRTIWPLAREPSRRKPAINGRIRIKLSSPAEQDLSINYSLGGTAHLDIDDGADYLLPTPNLGLVVIPKGQRFVDLVITPLADDLRERPETVQLTLQPTSLPTLNDYQLGRRISATVWILDRRR
jgi:hypothetical protein